MRLGSMKKMMEISKEKSSPPAEDAPSEKPILTVVKPPVDLEAERDEILRNQPETD